MLSSLPANSDDLVVNTTSDVVNGDVSSPNALKANPGPDGISLREAIEAVNKVPGTHTIAISPSLAGMTLQLTGGLPIITRDGVTLQGLQNPDGQPNFTVDAAGARATVEGPAAISVYASDFKMSGFRIIRVPSVFRAAITVEAGATYLPGLPSQINNVRIENNVLSNAERQYHSAEATHAIDLRTNPMGRDANLTNISIVENTIDGFGGESDGVAAGAGGVNSQIDNLIIDRNTFSRISYPVEFGNGTGPGTSMDRMYNVRVTANTFRQNPGGIFVLAGPGSDCVTRGVLIEGNVFSENHGAAIQIGMVSGNRIAIANLRVVDNTIEKSNSGLMMNVVAGGEANVIDDLLIEGNRFLDENIAIHLNTQGAGNTIQNTVVTNNLTHGTVTIRCEGTQNTVRNTLIAGNWHLGSDVFLSIYSVMPDATENIVEDTQIINNLISHGMNITGGILMASRNRVERVSIVNNTVVSRAHGLQVLSDAEGGSGNSVSGVQVMNTVFQTVNGDFIGEVAVDQVGHCITSMPGFVGVNGNFSADPLFVDSIQGDYHLQPGSPAIDTGTSEGAPLIDLECRERIGTPDIGAFEFGSTPVARLTMTTAGTGSGTVIPNPIGRNCVTNDSVFYNIGTVVTLTPVPAMGSIFAGWHGDDECSDGVVIMDSNKTCVATFNLQPTSVLIPKDDIPSSFELKQNYPNPFNPATDIAFSLPRSSYVTLKIFNILAEEVATLVDQKLVAGRYEVQWNASGMPSGIYVCLLQIEGFTQARKLLLLK